MRVDIFIPDIENGSVGWVRSFDLPGPPPLGTVVDLGQGSGPSWEVRRVLLFPVEPGATGTYYQAETSPGAPLAQRERSDVDAALLAAGWERV